MVKNEFSRQSFGNTLEGLQFLILREEATAVSYEWFVLQKMSTLYKTKGNSIESLKWFDKAIHSDSIITLLNYGLLKYINEQKIDKKRAENMFISAIHT